MKPILYNIIKRIFTSGDFEKTIGEKIATKEDPLFDFFSMQIPSDLLTIVDRDRYTASGSIGKGNRLHSYWFAIFDKRITSSAARGVYVVYLLSYDGERLYLTLNQGSDGDSSVGLSQLRSRATVLSQQLTNVGDFDVGPVFIEQDAKGRTKNFSEGTIFSKVYNKRNEIPSEETLRKDLENMLKIYGEYAEQNGYGETVMPPQDKEHTSGLKDKDMNYQKIYFGAPGTGKSFCVDKITDGQQVFRTTFHPDYDYAQFAGSYKPTKISGEKELVSAEEMIDLLKSMNDEKVTYAVEKFGAKYYESLKKLDSTKREDIVKKSGCYASAGTNLLTGMNVGEYVLNGVSRKDQITYDFIPQVFANAYVAAYKNPDQPVYLVIEEINRGNCAQIFGDIFQLLDRNDDGYSCYEINADADFAGWLSTQGLPGKLKLPPNFNILATMNTSDQSLFPMDSAFKRRFDWEYVPISFEGKSAADFKIENSKGEPYSWQAFVERINEKILDLTESEDKQLGEYFIKPDLADNVISENRFKGKVMFYLWNEICKDEHKHGSFFKIDGKFFTFQDLYNGKANLADFIEEIVNADSEEAQ